MKTTRPLGLRLALSYLLVILLGMGIAAPLAWLAVENLYLETQKANLLAQANLAAAALQTIPLPVGDTPQYSQMSNTMPGIHTRVLGSSGAVLIDLSGSGQSLSPVDLSLLSFDPQSYGAVTPEELLARPEISQALGGEAATAVRRIEAAGGQRVLYAAAPVLSETGAVSQLVYLAMPLPNTQWTALPGSLRLQLFLALLVAVLLSSGAGLLLSRRIARPLEKLASAAHAVAAGDLNQSVPVDPAIHELAQVGTAFNHMTASLRQADQAQTAFISDVSHELRTPLTVIKGTIETLQDGALDDLDARGPFLQSMSHETDRLIRLVNDLLVLTRADAGALNLQLRAVDMPELARQRCTHLERTAAARQVHLRVETDSSACAALADADRMAQVLNNLLDNAIRYAPPGSEVLVRVSSAAGRVTVQVSDCGAGIPARHLPLIFDRFYRADSARGRAQGGSGLGLSIVRSLVLAHSGEISVHSEEGKGTTFTFWLPAAN